VFAIAVVGLVYASLEACALLTFWLMDARRFSFARVWALQRTHAAEGSLAEANPDVGELRGQTLHPYLGVVGNPRRNPARFNEYGFNDLQDPLHKRSPKHAIVGIAGGSVANQFFQYGSAHLRELLERSPIFAGKTVVFVNTAQNAYKQPQQLLALTYLLTLGGEVDIFINIDGFNEIALYPRMGAPRGAFPLFPAFWGISAEGLPDLVREGLIGEAAYVRGIRRRWAEGFTRGPWRYSVAANLLWRLRDDQLTARIIETNKALQEHVPSRRSYAATGPTRRHRDEREMYEDLVGIWRRCSEQTDKLARGNGIAYFHFLQPNQHVAGSKEMTREEQRMMASRQSDSLNAYPHIVEVGYPLLVREGAALSRAAVRFTELTGVFAGVSETVYQDACCHLNRRGNEIMAEAIAAAILGALDPSR
jgi:hypothetical protein